MKLKVNFVSKISKVAMTNELVFVKNKNPSWLADKQICLTFLQNVKQNKADFKK